MLHLIGLIGQAVGLFISTDLDDILVLIIFFADPRFRVSQIIAGQYLGIAILYAVSILGSWIALSVPPAFVGLLGLVPITMGLKGAWNLWRPAHPGEQALPGGRINIAAVIAMTVANGGDNVSVYVPLFALRSGLDVALMGVVFAVMTALWLILAYWLTRHRAIGTRVRQYTRLLMPLVFITLGVLILYQAGTVRLLCYHRAPPSVFSGRSYEGSFLSREPFK